MTLYEALLDGIDDEPLARPEDALELVDEDVDVLVDEADLDVTVLEDDDAHDPDLDVNTDELLAEIEESDSWSDDPVRMYLTRWAKFPCSRGRRK